MDDLRINIQETGQNLGILAAWFSGVVLFWKKGIRPAIMQIQYFQEVLGKLDKVIAELVPNGGSSLRDAVNRIESRQIVSESRAKALLLDSDIGMWESNEEGHCTWWNRTLEHMHGREPAGMNWIASVAPEERESVVTEWQEAVRLKREFYMNITYQRQDGTRTPCIVKAYPLLDNKKTVKGWVGVATRVKHEQ